MQFNRNRPSGRFGRKPSFNNRFKNRGGTNTRGRFRGSKIDVSKYINKSPTAKPEPPIYVPTNMFSNFPIDQKLKANIIAKGYSLPTPIQDKSIPVILNGSDIVGIANTGTGKTAAFLVPLLNKVMANKKEKVLIVAPTRELALQINQELLGFAKGLGIHSVCCVGGVSISYQLKSLRLPYNFIIGTPGRIKDVIERKALSLECFKSAVLDEADRMLDMGFINDMRFMLDKMPKDRQTLFFSATLSNEIEKLIGSFLKNPVRISVQSRNVSANIEQDIIRVTHPEKKLDQLHELLIRPECERVLIFGRTKHGVERLSKTLETRGFKSASIHGNKSQNQRERALKDFKESRAKILVATDVAARGLDIADVTHVINYDIPATHEDYIHRIGRTGRANKKGKAFTFVE